MESIVIEKVGEAISKINNAKHVDDVVLAIHSLALLLFPLDSSSISGSINEKHRNQIIKAQVPSEVERFTWIKVFYRGTGFPTMARILLRDVTLNWLACFPVSARKHVYDPFFVHGHMIEVVQALVPCLQHVGNNDLDANAIRSNVERLIILCLLENDGVAQMAREFGSETENSIGEHVKENTSLMAQIVSSIPDKVQMGAPVSLSSHLFFKHITNQIISLSKEEDLMEGTFLFVGDIFSRICRRGSVDVLVSEIVPMVLRHAQKLLKSTVVLDVIQSNPDSQFWSNTMLSIKDTYAVERISEQLLSELATQRVSDTEAYWILWILFHRAFSQQESLRSMFTDKFLLWKVFPVRCLRWIIHFSLLEIPPDAKSIPESCDAHYFLEAVQCLVSVWSKREFMQSATMEQQIYITAAIGLSLENMSKKQLDDIKEGMHSILQGVSCRLESPNHLVRRMASHIALVFSKVIDPNNPLYLDDSCDGEAIDWEFGSGTSENGHVSTTRSIESVDDNLSTSLLEKDVKHIVDDESNNKVKRKNKKVCEYKLIDPDEVVDPITLNCDSEIDEDNDDDNGSENSDSSSDSSLQPYDLQDDDADLKKNFTQLVDVVGALRKTDNADGVEKALDVAESLIRASPDELRHVARDLVRTLVQVRCSDLAVEGEEESAEDKRQRALIASVVMSPFESLETLNKLLYSPTVDVSQRTMILDVMTNAAQELADSKTTIPKPQTRTLISTVSETQAWFLPSEVGPPGAGLWEEISEPGGSLLNWANRYVRELPPKPGQTIKGKTRRWAKKSANVRDNQSEWSHNRFPMYAATFMLPAMEGFDKRRQGVDLLNRDFIVLGKLVYMLGVCMKCAALHPEASTLASPLLDLLKSRQVYNHKEAYVRKAVLFAASCVLSSLHPTFIANSLSEGNLEFAKGLEWIRTWAIHVAEADTDRECYTMAMACLQLHSEMALRASRALESADEIMPKVGNISALQSHLSKATISIPYNTIRF